MTRKKTEHLLGNPETVSSLFALAEKAMAGTAGLAILGSGLRGLKGPSVKTFVQLGIGAFLIWYVASGNTPAKKTLKKYTVKARN